MARIPLPDGITILHGLEANRTSVIPDAGEPLWTTDTQRLLLGDGATPGAVPLSANIEWIEWAGHGLGATLPANGIIAVSSDGAALTQAQATVNGRPSFYVVRIVGNWLGTVTGGLVYLPNTNLVAGAVYWLDSAAANTLVTAEPSYSVPVCHVVRTVGTGAWARFLDWRAWDRDSSAAQATTTARFVRFTFTAHQASGNVAVLSEIELYDTDVAAGSAITSANNKAMGATVTASTSHGSYGGPGVLNDLATGTNWASDAAPPYTVDFDLGAGNGAAILSYALTNATDGGNSPFYPTAWTVSIGDDLGALTVVDTRTAQSFTTGERKAFDLP